MLIVVFWSSNVAMPLDCGGHPFWISQTTMRTERHMLQNAAVWVADCEAASAA